MIACILTTLNLKRNEHREGCVRSHIGWGGERNIFYKGMETSPYQIRFKNLEGKPKEDNIC